MHGKKGLKKVLLKVLFLGLISSCGKAPTLSNPKPRDDVPQLDPKEVIPESYFPTPKGGVWRYEMNLDQFAEFKEDSSIESSDLLVTITSDNIRREEFYLKASETAGDFSSLHGKIHMIGEAKLYKEGNTVGVSNQTLKMKIEICETRKECVEESETEVERCLRWEKIKKCGEMKAEMFFSYSPFLPFLFDTVNLKPGDINEREIKVVARSKTKMEVEGETKEEEEEEKKEENLICSIRVQNQEKITTSLGSFDTIKVERTCKPKEEATKLDEESVIWYLARGIGLIKASYIENADSFDPMGNLEQKLFETNLINR